jgi:double-stranded uracil-DNA glycosylase
LGADAVPEVIAQGETLEVLVWEEETAKLVRDTATRLGIPVAAVRIVRLFPFLHPYPSDSERNAEAYEQFLAEHLLTDADGNEFVLTSLPPVTGESPNVLILGSMPGAISLRQNQYYANATNRFWKVMEAVAGVRPDDPYEQRTLQLTKRRLALWDTLKHCTRVGSLDAAIVSRSEIPNDIANLLQKHTSLSRIVFNGKKAAASFCRLVEPQLPDDLNARVSRLTVPSTSAANAKARLADLITAWRDALEH